MATGDRPMNRSTTSTGSTYDTTSTTTSGDTITGRKGQVDYDATDSSINRDYTGTAGTAESKWDESSKVGTAGGSVAGAATGAAIGSVAGPVGTAIGGVAGALTGAGVGAAGFDMPEGGVESSSRV